MCKMLSETLLNERVKRRILWDGRDFTFTRYAVNEYHEKTKEIEKQYTIKGIYHDGGGYGGMLNIELLEREGSRDLMKTKPMILCLCDDISKDVQMDDRVFIGDDEYFVAERTNLTNYNIAYEISLERAQDLEKTNE